METEFVYDKSTPILFLVFNRPNTTQQVFEKIKEVEPARLYIAADGPRNSEEKEKCDEVRRIVSDVTWKCEVILRFHETNLGCKNAVSSAISWFFEREPEGIILEDDCLPSNTFFSFCSTLLRVYRNEDKIGHIGGSNFQNGLFRGDGDYYFSNLTHVWGWAGWRRIWKNYDADMTRFPEAAKKGLLERSPSHQPYKEYWLHAFEQTHRGMINTWDYQYSFCNLLHGKVSIIPNVNLITNLGFGEDATHTFGDHPFASLPAENFQSLIHPSIISADVEADIFTQEIEYQNFEMPPKIQKNFLSRCWKRIKSFLKKSAKG